MGAVHTKAARATAAPLLSVGDLVLLRIASGGASRAELQRDVAPLVAPHVGGTAFRRAAELAIGQFSGQGFLLEAKGRLSATAAGLARAEALIASGRIASQSWDEVRNGPLLAYATGLNGDSPAILKALERPDSLAALVLQRHFGMSIARPYSINDLRTELAVVALEKAFGNKIKTGLGKGSGLPGKTARLLAGQLFRKPRTFASDGKLVVALAAEISGAASDTLDGLRLALLRRLTTSAEAAEPAAEAAPSGVREPRAAIRPKAANDAAPIAGGPPRRGPLDMSEFVSSVLDAARPISEGWPGNRKAFISRVWQAIRIARREWELTEIAFKGMLAEAHRSGQLVLATADLKDKSALKDLEESKILYKNTVWHFVRVED